MATIALIADPLVFWTGYHGQTMNLGGDNSLLYFEYPQAWLSNTALPALSQNLSGYNPIPQYAPLATIEALFHALHINAEGLTFGLVLGGLFLGSVLVVLELQDLLAPEWGPTARKYSALLAGVLVVSAPLLAETQWTTVLPELFWMILLPWLLWFFLRYQASGRVVYCLYAAGLCTVCSLALPDAPMSISCILAAILITASLRASGSIRFHFRRVAGFTLAIIAASAFWLIPFSGALILPQLQVQGALSGSGKQAASAIVNSLAPLQSARDAVTLQQSSTMMRAYQWPQLIPAQWSHNLDFLGMLPLILLLVGLCIAVASRTRTRRLTTSLVSLSLATTFLLVLYCPSLPGGTALSLTLIRYIPGWTAERNFYVAFGLPYAFLYAITAAMAAGVILNSLAVSTNSGRYFRTIPIAVMLVITCMLAYNMPFFRGDYFRLPYRLGSDTNRVMEGLGPDYLNLLGALRRLPPGPVLSLPLSQPAWTVVGPFNDIGGLRGEYIGVSPIYFLTGRSEFNGLASFSSPVAPQLPQELENLLNLGDVTDFAQVARLLGIQYVIVNTSEGRTDNYSNVGAVSNPLLEQTESTTIANSLAPEVIGRFGPYELRKVIGSEAYPVALIPTSAIKPTSTQFTQLLAGIAVSRPVSVCPGWRSEVVNQNVSGLDIVIRRLPSAQTGNCTLVLDLSGGGGWVATLNSGPPAVTRLRGTLLFGILQSFDLPRSGQALRVHIGFQYQRMVWIGYGTTLGAWVTIMLVYAIRRVARRKRELR
jgi:hypothetical protein